MPKKIKRVIIDTNLWISFLIIIYITTASVIITSLKAPVHEWYNNNKKTFDSIFLILITNQITRAD